MSIVHICPICNSNAYQSRQLGSTDLEYECIRCGKYTFKNMVNRRGAFVRCPSDYLHNNLQQAAIGSWLRSQSQPTLTFDQMIELRDNLSFPTHAEQKNRLLRHIGHTWQSMQNYLLAEDDIQELSFSIKNPFYDGLVVIGEVSHQFICGAQSPEVVSDLIWEMTKKQLIVLP